MWRLNYIRTFSHPEIWDELFEGTNIPEGYELREKNDHKKKRLESEVKQEETNIEAYKRYLAESEKKIKKLKDELKDLD